MTSRVLYVVSCAAPPASDVVDLVSLAQSAGWRVFMIATPLGMRFLDVPRLESLTGAPVRHQWRMPGEEKSLPRADAAIVAPATFNTINKWAYGITDAYAVGALCELTGFRVPILAVPFLKDALAVHSAFARNVAELQSMGVHVLSDPAASSYAVMPPWEQILTELNHLLDG